MSFQIKPNMNMGVGTEVAWTPQMLTDERVHNMIIVIQTQMRIINRTHIQNVQLYQDLYLFYGLYFRPLLIEKYRIEYDKNFRKIKQELNKISCSDNKKTVTYSYDIVRRFEDIFFSIIKDFQQSMSYFYKGKIRLTNLDNVEEIQDGN